MGRIEIESFYRPFRQKPEIKSRGFKFFGSKKAKPEVPSWEYVDPKQDIKNWLAKHPGIEIISTSMAISPCNVTGSGPVTVVMVYYRLKEI